MPLGRRIGRERQDRPVYGALKVDFARRRPPGDADHRVRSGVGGSGSAAGDLSAVDHRRYRCLLDQDDPVGFRNDADIRARMATLGVTPLGEDAAHAEAFFNQELDRWKAVIDRAGIKLAP